MTPYKAASTELHCGNMPSVSGKGRMRLPVKLLLCTEGGVAEDVILILFMRTLGGLYLSLLSTGNSWYL